MTSFSVSGQANSENLGTIQVKSSTYDWVDTEGKKISTTGGEGLTQWGMYFSVFDCKNQEIGMIVVQAYLRNNKIEYAIRKNNRNITVFSPTNQEETFFKAESNGKVIATIGKSHNKDEWHITIYDHSIVHGAMLVTLTAFFTSYF